MINFKSFAPTTAFVFTGYGLTACNNDSQNLAADPIQQPAPVVAEPESIPAPAIPTIIPEQTLKPIELALKTHPMAPANAVETLQRAYQILKGDGVTLEQLDAGCHQKEEIVGAGDRKVEACEVYEYALDHYKDHRRATDLLALGTVPWVLDDLDLTTDFDAKVREKVDHAIGALKESPALKDLDPTSNQYRDKLAFGLFYYVSFPDQPIRGRAAKKRWAELTRELRVLGLHDFQAYLFQAGGLGIHGFRKREPVSNNVAALNALEEKEGGSPAKANILYAVFDMAGLEPFFINIPYTVGDAHQDFDEGLGRDTRYIQSEYTGVGIPVGDSFQLFHPQEMLALRSYTEHSRRHSLRHHMGIILHSMGVRQKEYASDDAKEHSYLRAGIDLWPEDGDAFNSLALSQSGEEREETLRAGLRADPENWFLNHNFAEHLAENGNHAAAVHYYWMALDSHPEYFTEEYLKAAKASAEKVINDPHRAVNEVPPPHTYAIVKTVDELLKGKK